MAFLQYWLKIKWFWYNANKKSGKKQLLSSVHAVSIQLREYIDSLRRCWGYHYRPFLKILFFMWCNLTAENKKNFSVHWHKGFVNYIFFFLSGTNQHFVFFFFHLWQRHSFFVLGILLLIFVTMGNVEQDTKSFWEDYINPFTRKNETKCVKIIPRFSVYVPIHN